MWTTLISAGELARHAGDPNWAVLDCRFALADTERGERDYLQAHIPGAVYAHLDRDLSGFVISGVTGRHPLPPVEKAVQAFSRMGIDHHTQVVAYDDVGGALAAVRAWWMLRWLGHEAAAVLDGGWQSWQGGGYPTRSGQETRPPTQFNPYVREGMFVTAGDVERLRQDPDWKLVDVRAPERYRGEVEPIDRVAGHIPGAVNQPYQENLNPDLTFRSPQELKVHYNQVLKDTPAERTVFYCGSGVTSIHSVLAVMHAGLGEPKLYPGSWSEWIAGGREAARE